MSLMRTINLGRTTYLGGLPDYATPLTRDLWFTPTDVGLGDQGPQHATMPVDRIRSLDVEDAIEAKSRLGATLAFGVVGALAAKGHKNRAMITIRLKDRSAVYFESQHATTADIVGRIATWMHEHQITSSDDARHADLLNGKGGLVDGLTQLESLHAVGALTDDEFTAAKARLLN